MALIEWDDNRYSTSVDKMDEQHKQLFKLLNDLHTAMEEGHADEEVGEILQELEDYTEYHFNDEENMMKDCGFASDCSECFHDHQDMHDTFETKVGELREKHENGEYITMDVLQFARDWLDAHIAGDDQDQNYGNFIRQEFDSYSFE